MIFITAYELAVLDPEIFKTAALPCPELEGRTGVGRLE
jgi:hypothetical protein